jgi:hypothetical protein
MRSATGSPERVMTIALKMTPFERDIILPGARWHMAHPTRQPCGL